MQIENFHIQTKDNEIQEKGFYQYKNLKTVYDIQVKKITQLHDKNQIKLKCQVKDVIFVGDMHKRNSLTITIHLNKEESKDKKKWFIYDIGTYVNPDNLQDEIETQDIEDYVKVPELVNKNYYHYKENNDIFLVKLLKHKVTKKRIEVLIKIIDVIHSPIKLPIQIKDKEFSMNSDMPVIWSIYPNKYFSIENIVKAEEENQAILNDYKMSLK